MCQLQVTVDPFAPALGCASPPHKVGFRFDSLRPHVLLAGVGAVLATFSSEIALDSAFFRNTLSSFIILKALLQWRSFWLLFLTECFIDLIYSVSCRLLY